MKGIITLALAEKGQVVESYIILHYLDGKTKVHTSYNVSHRFAKRSFSSNPGTILQLLVPLNVIVAYNHID
jgi:hypothetical protein